MSTPRRCTPSSVRRRPTSRRVASSATGRARRSRRASTRRRSASPRSCSLPRTGRTTSPARFARSSITRRTGHSSSSSPMRRPTAQADALAGPRRDRSGRTRDRDRGRSGRAPVSATPRRSTPGSGGRWRRSVLLMDTSVEPQGDLVSAVAGALADATVAVAGPFGIVSDDLRTFVAAPDAAVDVDAIEGYALGFRRGGLRAARAARRALPLLREPRHLVEPRAPGPGRGRPRRRPAATRRPRDRRPGRPPRASRLGEPRRTTSGTASRRRTSTGCSSASRHAATSSWRAAGGGGRGSA